MSLKDLLNTAAVTLVAAGLCASAQAAGAQSARPKTQAAAESATGTATTDSASATQSQGTAWAVKQAAEAGPAAIAPTSPAPSAAAQVTPHGDIVETLRASGQFTTFLKAAAAANLTRVLKGDQNLTVFAPTDAAFQALPPGELDRLMANRDQLQKLLTHHIINARVDSAKIRGAKGPVPSVAGDSIELDGAAATLKADNADIVQADVMASNGLVQVVDRVLSPGAAAAGANAQPAAATEAASSGAQTSQDAMRPPARKGAAPKR